MGLGLLFLFFATEASAHLALTAEVGGLVGTFAKAEESLKATGYAYGFALNWHPEHKSQVLPFSIGLTGKQSKLSYMENNINKDATHNVFGPNLGLYLPINELFIVQIFAQYYPAATLSTLSTNSVVLNSNNFKYATWEAFSGTAAFEGRINFTHDKTDGQFNKKNRFRSGIGVSCLQQTFLKSHTEISTSRDALKPTTTVSNDKISDRLMLLTVDFFLGLTF
ncbi:MAG: hypothetical protein H7249_01235 [Chitinophagaceae bacterium]|nr:hypothetical protein [Oligoflexus sp.]